MQKFTGKIFWMILGALVLGLAVWGEFRAGSMPSVAARVKDLDLPNLGVYRLQTWVAALSCIAVYSFLFKENPFYRFFEHALLGCATGYSCAVVMRQNLYSQWLVPIKKSIVNVMANGWTPSDAATIALIFAGVIGLLWYFQYSKKYFWVSRIAMCISLGAGAGLAFKDTFNQLIPQITGTFKNVCPTEYVMPGASLLDRFYAGCENAIFVIGTVSVLMYFFFAFGNKNTIVKGSSKIGRWYLMIALGAFFGNTFMSRLSALIERVHFLMAEWLLISQM
jgi:hypothetical protein